MFFRLKVTQTRSSIGRSQRQRDTIRGMGLKKIGQMVLLDDTPQSRVMVNSVQHLVVWEEVQNG
jgi:large subunit ribosomal protein L30